MIHIVDLREERKAGNYSPLSEELQKRIHNTLRAKKQVLLFHNRRGLATGLICESCGDVIECPACAVSLTYHRTAREKQSKLRHFLMCHYCGIIEHVPSLCPTCKAPELKPMGTGTQHIEDVLHQLFPKARIGRLDRDSMTTKGTHQHVIEEFRTQELDILLGTQMITKGHDFPGVSLIGIILAEHGLSIPDFRARERTYQLLTQVAGRAGRRGQASDVVVQTYNPEDITPELLSETHYQTLYQQELQERAQHEYPPFSKIIKLTYVHPSRDQALRASEQLLTALRQSVSTYKLPPHHISRMDALIPKVHNKYHMNILVRGSDPHAVVRPLLPLPPHWRIDVDPLSMA